MAKITLAIFVVKEVIVTITGFRVICLQGKNEGAKWYGKLSTVIFYMTTIILVLFSEWGKEVGDTLLGICGVAMIGAFIGYMKGYIEVFRNNRKKRTVY